MNPRFIFSCLLLGALASVGAQQAATVPPPGSYEKALELMADGKYGLARLAYGEFLQRSPNDPLAPRAAFERAQCLLMEDKTEEGVREMIALSQKYPDSDDAPLALWVAVHFFLVEKPDKQQAWLYAEQILKKYPDHPIAAHVRDKWPSIEKMSPAELAREAKALKAMEKQARKTSKK